MRRSRPYPCRQPTRMRSGSRASGCARNRAARATQPRQSRNSAARLAQLSHAARATQPRRSRNSATRLPQLSHADDQGLVQRASAAWPGPLAAEEHLNDLRPDGEQVPARPHHRRPVAVRHRPHRLVGAQVQQPLQGQGRHATGSAVMYKAAANHTVSGVRVSWKSSRPHGTPACRTAAAPHPPRHGAQARRSGTALRPGAQARRSGPALRPGARPGRAHSGQTPPSGHRSQSR